MGQSVFLRPEKPQRRVVVTGMGVVSPAGIGVETNWDNIINGRSGIGPITQFDASDFPAKIAGEVKNFNPDLVIEKKEQKKMDRFILFALEATRQAIEDSGLELESDELLRARTGSLIGVGIGGLPMIEAQCKVLQERGPGRISPFFIPAVITNMASGHITIKYGLRGPNFSVTSACASGAHSIGESAKYIRDGHCDVMIAGGCEAAVTALGVGGFAAMKALSTRNSSPELASRPFDRDRDGFVLSEGSAILVLEDFEHASRRNAHIYAEVSGYGFSSDAYHMTNPAPGGEGAALSMKLALNDAGLKPDQVQYANAHGTSTPVGDGIESQAMKTVFGDHAKKLWVSSTKSIIGHTLGAAGAIESAYCLLALKHQVAPPTINLENPSDDCDLDYVPLTARDGNLKHVLNNSFGFGGTNASLVFSKLD
ncbi:MAG: beta-ketoacyl-ACP synthase II [Bdellovibrionales bacterium]|nr:beta-ketoacyl-ACP synthase II [Bdellovibrionales bacterium]